MYVWTVLNINDIGLGDHSYVAPRIWKLRRAFQSKAFRSLPSKIRAEIDKVNWRWWKEASRTTEWDRNLKGMLAPLKKDDVAPTRLISSECLDGRVLRYNLGPRRQTDAGEVNFGYFDFSIPLNDNHYCKLKNYGSLNLMPVHVTFIKVLFYLLRSLLNMTWLLYLCVYRFKMKELAVHRTWSVFISCDVDFMW